MLYHKKIEGVYNAVASIKAHAADLRNATTMDANVLATRIMNIREFDAREIAFILNAGPKAPINTILDRFISGWGADPYDNLQAVRANVVAFMAAANALKASLGDIVDWTAGGLQYVTVSSGQLATLHASLDGLIAALAPLNTD